MWVRWPLGLCAMQRDSSQGFSCPAGHSPAGEKNLEPTAVDPRDKKWPSAKPPSRRPLLGRGPRSDEPSCPEGTPLGEGSGGSGGIRTKLFPPGGECPAGHKKLQPTAVGPCDKKCALIGTQCSKLSVPSSVAKMVLNDRPF